MQAKGSPMALKSMENFTRSQKQGYHRPHNDLQNLNKESRSNQCLDFNSTAKPKHNRVLEINVQHRMTCMKTTAKGNKADGCTILGIIISNILVKKVTQVQAEMLSKISVNVMIIFYSNIWRRISSIFVTFPKYRHCRYHKGAVSLKLSLLSAHVGLSLLYSVCSVSMYHASFCFSTLHSERICRNNNRMETCVKVKTSKLQKTGI